MPDDIRARLGSRPYQSPLSPLQRPSQAHTFVSPQSALRRAQDLCSIFVGNLPANVDEDSLRDAFSVNGHVHKIEIVRKASVNSKFLPMSTLYKVKIMGLLMLNSDWGQQFCVH